jgi:polysaccharide biosynthesis protein PelA
MRFFLLALTFAFCMCSEGNEPIARKILVFFDSRFEEQADETFAHKICEMPLNHLGIDLIYHDLKEPLPKISSLHGIRGILTCFPDGMTMDDPTAYLQWAETAIDAGKKFVILKDPGFKLASAGTYTPADLINRFYRKLGIHDKNDWTQYTFHYQILNKDQKVVEFEHPYPTPLPPFSSVTAIAPEAISYLTLGILGDETSRVDLVVTSPNGGYVSQYYAASYTKEQQAPEARYWYIDPFRFFQLAFDLENLPVPDITTLAGRRIFFSQINGDAWNTISEIEKYRRQRALCSEILYHELLTAFPNLPVSVGIIAADIDPAWVGNVKSQQIAQKIIALSHVETASHTYSHPFNWEFFKNPDQQIKEIDFLHLYPYGSWQSTYLSWFRAAFYWRRGKISINEKNLGLGYVTPRAYANHPFDLENEISGSFKYIQQFVPPEKKINLFQWSGDCRPWEEAIGMTRQLGLRNINGGFVRKDQEYPSYCNVGSIGRRAGSQIQIYAASNDENDYTNDWSDRFYGFRYVIETFKNTEHPKRVKPLNLYFHCYSAQYLASWNALLDIITFIQTQKIIPIWPSRYASIADGFYSVQIQQIGFQLWQIKNREGLQTIRFDHPTISIDYARSYGVVGHKRFQQALYVYLDAAENVATIALEASEKKTHAHLVESGTEIWDLKRENRRLSFKTKGWGFLQMIWFLPGGGKYKLLATDGNEKYETEAVSAEKDIYHFFKSIPSNKELQIEIVRVQG